MKCTFTKSIILMAVVFSLLTGQLYALNLRPSQDIMDRLSEGHSKGIQLGTIFSVPGTIAGATYGLTQKKPVTYAVYGGLTGFLSGYLFGFILPSVYGYPGIFIVDKSIMFIYTRSL